MITCRLPRVPRVPRRHRTLRSANLSSTPIAVGAGSFRGQGVPPRPAAATTTQARSPRRRDHHPSPLSPPPRPPPKPALPELPAAAGLRRPELKTAAFLSAASTPTLFRPGRTLPAEGFPRDPGPRSVPRPAPLSPGAQSSARGALHRPLPPPRCRPAGRPPAGAPGSDERPLPTWAAGAARLRSRRPQSPAGRVRGARSARLPGPLRESAPARAPALALRRRRRAPFTAGPHAPPAAPAAAADWPRGGGSRASRPAPTPSPAFGRAAPARLEFRAGPLARCGGFPRRLRPLGTRGAHCRPAPSRHALGRPLGRGRRGPRGRGRGRGRGGAGLALLGACGRAGGLAHVRQRSRWAGPQSRWPVQGEESRFSAPAARAPTVHYPPLLSLNNDHVKESWRN
ncbi:hypothetical protein GH733_017884 [Mirounga leonina]|nr:hypothetical protein GH733_017884 [Mirounga leonina]